MEPISTDGAQPLASLRSAEAPIRSLWPFHGEDEIAAVSRILRSGRVNALLHGEHRAAFEDQFAAYIGGAYAIAVANGTLALELALRALGIGVGDEVIVTPRSYFASVSCIVAVGATPVFAEIDPVSQNIDPDNIARMLTPRSRAVICVHLAGWPCDMNPIMALCRQRGIKVIEDCAQALGAVYRGRKVGSFGDAAAFSFCTDKIISTGGEGGMLIVEDEAVWERAWSYKDHGKSHAKFVDTSPAPGGFRWLHDSFGSNFRMTEMQAAIGSLQLAKLPEWLAARRRNAALLDTALSGIPALRVARPPEHIEHAYYKYYCFLRSRKGDNGEARDAVVANLQRLHVPCGSGSCPEIYLEEAFAGVDAAIMPPLPVARRIGATSIMVPVDPSLDINDIQAMAARFRRCLVPQAK